MELADPSSILGTSTYTKPCPSGVPEGQGFVRYLRSGTDGQRVFCPVPWPSCDDEGVAQMPWHRWTLKAIDTGSMPYAEFYTKDPDYFFTRRSAERAARFYEDRLHLPVKFAVVRVEEDGAADGVGK